MLRVKNGRYVTARDSRRPYHRSGGSWDALCGVTDNGSNLITDRDSEVTCKRCLAKMRRLIKKYGPGVAR